MPFYDPSAIAQSPLFLLGARVDCPATLFTTLFTTSKVPVFKVNVGRVLVRAIIGKVTVQGGADATLAKWTGTPTAGSAVDLCANSASLSTVAVGKVLVTTGTLATALTIADAGGALLQATSQAVDVGTIDITGSVSGTAGAAKFSIWYMPLEDGANVTSVF